MTEARLTIRRQEDRIGGYEIGAAVSSYGDLLYIVNPPGHSRVGVLLADTAGHDLYKAKLFKKALNRAVDQGWGLSENAGKEIKKLAHLYETIAEEYYRSLYLIFKETAEETAKKIENQQDFKFKDTEFENIIIHLQDMLPIRGSKPWFREVCCSYFHLYDDKVSFVTSAGLPLPIVVGNRMKTLEEQGVRRFGLHLESAVDVPVFTHKMAFKKGEAK